MLQACRHKACPCPRQVMGADAGAFMPAYACGKAQRIYQSGRKSHQQYAGHVQCPLCLVDVAAQPQCTAVAQPYSVMSPLIRAEAAAACMHCDHRSNEQRGGAIESLEDMCTETHDVHR